MTEHDAPSLRHENTVALPRRTPRSPNTIVRSTTGTAPMEIAVGPGPDDVRIYLENGCGQVYSRTALLAALGAHP